MIHRNNFATSFMTEPTARMVGGRPFMTMNSISAGRMRTRTNHLKIFMKESMAK